MSYGSTGSTDTALRSPVKPRRLSLSSLFSVFGAVLFVAASLFAVSSAFVWLVESKLHFGVVATVILSIAVGVPGVLAVIATARIALRAETDPEIMRSG